ncbi:Os07g0439900 [Oryza sativa Japonica Group]|uniref:Os07g0439900 protein n=1 Tax=Oryza sativa subsp. japonica TaxID=39947 RepID=C7J585_ORYSJ|nr:Os07g0439900 [Oryza sativa Japonica Group]|eukprot:NP_001175174.1 Os07g0439900 [Oryza sativa Japonica Group]
MGNAPTPPTLATPEAETGAASPEFVSPPSNLTDTLDADHDDDVPLRFRTVENILRHATTPGLVHLELDSANEHAVYTRVKGDAKLIIGVYVDDLIITGPDQASIGAFKREMCNIFKMSDLGLLSYYLGLEVKQREIGISLCQLAYAGKLLDKSGMGDCNACATPMETRLKLSKTSMSPLVNAMNYRSIIGGLCYLVNTRPDIAHVVGYLSRFMEELHEDHQAAVKHVLRYIAGTWHHGVHYARKQDGKPALHGFSDSDMAGDLDTRRSTSSTVSWQSTKQKVVALSLCEAEYIAATAVACQGVWQARLLSDLLNSEPGAPEIKVDNKKIVVNYVRTEEQLADVLTKPLGHVRFQELCNGIGIVELDGDDGKN